MRIPYVHDFIEKVAPKTKEEFKQQGVKFCFATAVGLSFVSGAFTNEAFSQYAQYKASVDPDVSAMPTIANGLGTLVSGVTSLNLFKMGAQISKRNFN